MQCVVLAEIHWTRSKEKRSNEGYDTVGYLANEQMHLMLHVLVL